MCDVPTNGNVFLAATVWDVFTNGNISRRLTVWDVLTTGNDFSCIIVFFSTTVRITVFGRSPLAHDLILPSMCARRAYPRRFLGRVGRTSLSPTLTRRRFQMPSQKGVKIVCIAPRCTSVCPKPKVKLGPTNLIYPAPPSSFYIETARNPNSLVTPIRISVSPRWPCKLSVPLRNIWVPAK